MRLGRGIPCIVALLCWAAGAPEAAAQAFSFPGVNGVRMPPMYDRVNGVSLAWGPRLGSLRWGEVEATVIYRSHRGQFDPAGSAHFTLGKLVSLDARGGRETRTNDAWIRSDLVNSFASLLAGADARNYYGATYWEASLSREFISRTVRIEPKIQVGREEARTVGGPLAGGSGAFSFFDRHDPDDGMIRPNPAITPGRTASARIGVTGEARMDDVNFTWDGTYEVPFRSPYGTSWSQLTFDGTVRFPTFGSHYLRLHTHVLASPGDSTPAQRYAYLGGSATFATTPLLAMGGDRLVFLESEYVIPFAWPSLFAFVPSISLRHLVGGAGVGRLPTLAQNVGVRATWGYLGVEWLMDPETRKSAAQAVFTTGR